MQHVDTRADTHTQGHTVIHAHHLSAALHHQAGTESSKRSVHYVRVHLVVSSVSRTICRRQQDLFIYLSIRLVNFRAGANS